MNRYQVIDLKTNEKICGFLSNVSDMDGLLRCVTSFSGKDLTWQWALQQEIRKDEWVTVIQSKASPEYAEYLDSIGKIKKFFGMYYSFEEFEEIKKKLA